MDGLRGIFVLAVLLFRAEISWAPGGFLGVSSFFTLSGFLITRLLVDERRATGAIDLGRFWTRRVRRLMPASLVTLGLLLLFGCTIATARQLGALRGDVLSALAYVSNWRFMTQARSYFEIFDRPSPVQHFWSLSIEEQFYLCYPLLVVAVWRWSAAPMRTLAVVLAALVGVGVASGIALTAAGAAPSRVYYGTDTRAPELLVGALLALWTTGDRDDTTYRASRDVAAAIGAIVLVAGIGWTSEDAITLPYGGLLANAIATAALVHAGTRSSRAGRLLAAAPLVWLGRVSYGVYLYHWPVYLWLDADRTGLATAPLFALRAGVTIAMAAVSYVAIERPVRRGSALAGRRLWLPTLTSAVAIAGGVVWITRLPNLATAATIDMQEHGMPTPESPETIRVLVVGDSVADNMAVGLQTWAATAPTPIALWDLAASACAIGRGGERPTLRRFRQLENHCRNWATLWRDAVDRFDPDVVVAHTGPLDLVDRRLDGWDHARGPGDPVFDAWLLGEMQAAADVLSHRGARLIWLNSPCVAKAAAGAPLAESGALDPARIMHLDSVILPSLWTSRAPAVRLFDLYGASCPKGRFQRMIPGTRTRLRTDHLHFSAEGAAWIAEQLGPIVLAVAHGRRLGVGQHAHQALVAAPGIGHIAPRMTGTPTGAGAR